MSTCPDDAGVVSTDGRANEALVTENGERAVKVGRRSAGGRPEGKP